MSALIDVEEVTIGVLFIDDNMEEDEPVFKEFQFRGFNTFLVTDPSIAFSDEFEAFLLDHTIKCVVLDVMMPPVPGHASQGTLGGEIADVGYDVHSQIRKLQPTLPVVFYSAKDGRELRTRASAGAYDSAVPKSKGNAVALANAVEETLSRQGWLKHALNIVDSIRRQQEPVYSKRYPHLNEDVLRRAEEVLKILSAMGVPEPDIGPTRRESVQIEWNYGDSGLEIEIKNEVDEPIVHLFCEVNGITECDYTLLVDEIEGDTYEFIKILIGKVLGQ